MSAARVQTPLPRFPGRLGQTIGKPSARVLAGIVALCSVFLCAFGTAGEPDQAARWKSAKLRPEWFNTADKIVSAWLRDKAIYQKLEAARANGVPAQFIIGFHERESSRDFKAHLHEGSPLNRRTRFVPTNRPSVWLPPSDWYSSALDALYDYEHLDRRDWKHTQSALQAAESYNGLGYQSKGRVSPYLWSGTNLFERGKYTGDGKFDPMARDQQIGVAAIMLGFQRRGITLPEALEPKAQPVIPAPTPTLVPAELGSAKAPPVPTLERPPHREIDPVAIGKAFRSLLHWLSLGGVVN